MGREAITGGPAISQESVPAGNLGEAVPTSPLSSFWLFKPLVSKAGLLLKWTGVENAEDGLKDRLLNTPEGTAKFKLKSWL